MRPDRLDPRSTIASHGARVGFAPARVLTSHARRVYENRYRGRFRFSSLVFLFDAFLVGMMVALLGVILFFSALSDVSWGTDLKLTLSSSLVRSADIVRFDALVAATDGKVHRDVVLQWDANGVGEVLSGLSLNQGVYQVYLGDISPGIERHVPIAMRFRAMSGAEVPIGFHFIERGLLGSHVSYGVQKVRVEASALEVSAATACAFPSGGLVPILARNTGSLPAEHASLLLVRRDGAPSATFLNEKTSLSLPTLEPGSERVVFVRLGDVQATSVLMGVSILSEGRMLEGMEWPIDIRDGAFPIDFVSSSLAADGHARVAYQNATNSKDAHARAVFLSRTDLHMPLQSEDLVAGTGTLAFSVPTSSWSILPLADLPSSEGAACLAGSPMIGPSTTTIAFTSEARYFTDAGDQVGLGSLRSSAEPLRYWVVWSLVPGDSGLKDILMETALPNGVRPTGRQASPVLGEFRQQKGRVTWGFPSVPASTELMKFAFEVERTAVRPDGVFDLVATTTVNARDASSGMVLSAQAPADDSSWKHDKKARQLLGL